MNAPDAQTLLPVSGRGVFYDGRTAAHHDVTVELAPQTLRMHAEDGSVLAEWPYDALETHSAPQGLLRLGTAGNPVLARLEIKDPRLIAAIDARSTPVDRAERIERRLRGKVIFWTIAATASLLLVAIVGVPLLAAEITPLIPYAIERKLGDTVDAQARAMLDTDHQGAAFECGNAANERAGRAAFDKLIAALQAGAALPFPLNVMVVRKKDANAITLPGGHIYVFAGLIDKAQSADELAGVIAHEMGHAAHRDSTRTLVESAGLSFLFGMLLGDFFGGGAVIYTSKTILQTSYSRAVEAAADAYSVMLMRKIGGDPRALGTILTRIAGSTHPGPKILIDHPETPDRVAAIERLAGSGQTRPLLDSADWAALKTICSGA
jgi:Zn-dependent protease with chaperone function